MGRHHRPIIVAGVLALAGCQKADDPTGTPARGKFKPPATDATPGTKSGGPNVTVPSELKPPATDARPFAATGKMPGIYPAGSRIKDQTALGGFGPSDNYPKDLAGREWGATGAVSVVAFPGEAVAYFEHQGFALRVVNRTAEAVPFAACDSSLPLVREARDAGGVWRAIESAPQTFCGNSYHRVFLGPGQYWEFPARLYTGPTKCRMRFRLDTGGEQPPVYSNEFDGHVTASQLAGG